MPITLNGDTGITTPSYGGTDTSEYLVPVTAFKNRLINGDMRIDQRNAGASVTPANGGADYIYTLDRWRVFSIANSKFSVQQNAGSVTPPVGFTNYLGITSLAATSVGSTDLYLLSQRIEGFNFADMQWGTANAQTVTLSFWVRSSLTGTFGGALQNSANNRTYPYSYTISSANTWEQKTVTIAGDTTGTWIGATNGVGCTIQFGLGVGSTYSGTAGAWSGSTLFSTTGATSVVGTNGATFYITGVQLEKGSTATSFDYRPYGTELALCQRYFTSSIANGSGGFTGTSLASAYTNAVGQAAFKVTMRATPTITLYDGGSNISGSATQLGVADNIPSTAANISVNGFRTITRNSSTWNTSANFLIIAGYDASAEL